MEQKESNRTHLQLHCLPHSGISTSPTRGTDPHVTIAIRSLFCSPKIISNDSIEYALNISSVSVGVGVGVGVSPLEEKKEFEIAAGAQFRVDAVMTGMGGVPHHSTPVRTVLSSGLKHARENQNLEGSRTRTSTRTSTRTRTRIPEVVEPQLTATHSCSWKRGNKLLLPVRYKDIQRDACIQLRLVTTRDRVLGEVMLPLWDDKGSLKTGLQKIKIPLMQNSISGLRLDRASEKENQVVDEHKDEGEEEDEKWEASLILDKLYQVENETSKEIDATRISTGKGGSIKIEAQSTSTTEGDEAQARNVLTTKSNDGSIECVPWLDRLTKERCIDILKEDVCPVQNGSSLDIIGRNEWAHLIVELPDCNIPIVYQEVPYVVGIHGASGSVTALDLSLYHHEQQQQKLTQKLSTDGINDGKIMMPQPINAKIGDDPNEINYTLVQILDMECPDDNPVEDKYRTLQHELIRGLVDPALKPDASERSRLNAIINGTSQHLTREEKDLLWRFRFSLVDNSRALTKFLLAVEWTVESEVVQAAELLEQWRKRSPINVSDALKLLGKNVAFQTGLVRAYAIDTLAAAPDAELELYLLQLVQALKFENNQDEGNGHRRMGSDNKSSSLGDFLIRRAAGSIKLANYLYWYLKVELDDANFGHRYHEVFTSMQEALLKVKVQDKTSSLDDRSMWDVLLAQDSFITTIMGCQRDAYDTKGKKDAKEKHLKDSLASLSCTSITNEFGVPLPSAPHIWVNGVQAESARMFKSALYPALLEFDVANVPDTKYKVIIKTGDDLRQDQLVIMFIKLFERILKRGALDLNLKPYPILATSQDTGLVEFVEGSMPISQILSKYNNSVLSFFKSVAPQEGAKYDVDPNVLQTYIRSCAGYCVITYLIGVGDRHLDNIMIQPSGHFFHIDFGFIFGRDPKPLPPPFRLTREMVDGMGGADSQEYKQFCSLACQTYNLLRKRAGLVLNLLHLMSDAGIEDLSNNPSLNAEAVIEKVEERFRLELNDEQAETYFIGLMNDCLAAIAPRVNDFFHQIAVSRR